MMIDVFFMFFSIVKGYANVAASGKQSIKVTVDLVVPTPGIKF